MGTYSKLARQAVEHMIKQGEPLPFTPSGPSRLQKQQACYVSIFENPGRRLYAIVGSILPRRPTIAQEIIAHATHIIATQQQRHIKRSDLPHLHYTVALLGPLQRISDPGHLDPYRFGLFVSSDRGKSAVLLPGRAGVETPNDQIATALREGAIDPRQEAVTMYRFEVTYDDD